MRRYVSLLTALIIGGLTVFSVQSTQAQSMYGGGGGVSFGIKAGPNFSNMTYKPSGDIKTSMITNFQGGVYANIPLADEFYVQPSLMYEGKGTKIKGDDLGLTNVDITVNPNYLTLPVDFLFKPEMPGGGSWFVGVGPYVGYGIGGKMKISGTDGEGNSISQKFDLFKDDLDEEGNGFEGSAMKRFDAGANVQLGYEFVNGFNIGLNANLGLVNLAKDPVDNESIKNTSFGVTVGYTF